MKYDILDDLMGSETFSDYIKNAESEEERELIVLTVIRNNLNTIRDSVNTIKGWVSFFGIMSIISGVLWFILFLI